MIHWDDTLVQIYLNLAEGFPPGLSVLISTQVPASHSINIKDRKSMARGSGASLPHQFKTGVCWACTQIWALHIFCPGPHLSPNIKKELFLNESRGKPWTLIHLSIRPSIHPLPTHPHIYIPIHPPIHQSTHPSISPSIHPTHQCIDCKNLA